MLTPAPKPHEQPPARAHSPTECNVFSEVRRSRYSDESPCSSCSSSITSPSVSSISKEAHYAVVLAPDLEVDGTIVVVDERFGEKPLVVVKPVGPIRDGRVLYLARLLAHPACSPPFLPFARFFPVR